MNLTQKKKKYKLTLKDKTHEFDHIRREVLDAILILLSELPFSFYKLFYDENYHTYLVSTDYIVDILDSRFKEYNIVHNLWEKILINSDLYDKNNKLVECGLSLQSKTELYYLLGSIKKQVYSLMILL